MLIFALDFAAIDYRLNALKIPSTRTDSRRYFLSSRLPRRGPSRALTRFYICREESLSHDSTPRIHIEHTIISGYIYQVAQHITRRWLT